MLLTVVALNIFLIITLPLIEWHLNVSLLIIQWHLFDIRWIYDQYLCWLLNLYFKEYVICNSRWVTCNRFF